MGSARCWVRGAQLTVQTLDALVRENVAKAATTERSVVGAMVACRDTMIKEGRDVRYHDGKGMDRRQALVWKRNERVNDGERKSDTAEHVQKCGDTRSLYVHSVGDIEEVWWVTRRSGLVRIRGAPTSPISCIRANVIEILVIDGKVIRGSHPVRLQLQRDISGWKTAYRSLTIGRFCLHDWKTAGDERHRLFCMRAVRGDCGDLHREEVRVKEYGGSCMNRNERRIACIRLMLGPDPA